MCDRVKGPAITGNAHRSGSPPSPLRGPADITRRTALRGIAGFIGGAALAACTPLRILAGWYPEEFDRDPELTDRVLRAFVDTIIPGAPPDDPNLARVFVDTDLPFADHAAFFAADLCRRSEALFGVRFHRLGRSRRVAVVQAALRSDGTTRRLYEGGIFLAQIAIYAGIYDDLAGCPLIEFEGRYRIRPLAELTFPNPDEFLPPPTTVAGNAA
jgi:hypothetical protein